MTLPHRRTHFTSLASKYKAGLVMSLPFVNLRPRDVMNDIDIVALDFELTDAIRAHVNSRVGKISRFWSRIHKVRVTLGDENGPRGGVDKFCRLAIELRSGTVVRVEKKAEDLYHAVSRCIAAAERVTAESVDREQRTQRRAPHGILV